MKTCLFCGKPIDRNAKTTSEYCSSKCRQAAYRARRKKKTNTMTDRTTKPKPTGKSEHVTVRVSDNVDAEINKADFDRMMDDSYEDLLRFSRDILKRALKDDRTPANAVANIAKELLNVGRELDAHSDQDILTSLDEDESEDVDDGIRTEII